MGLLKVPSRGGISVRSIIGFALSVIITAFLWAAFTSAPSHAQASGAAWNSSTGTILHDAHGYNLNKDLKDPTGTIPSGSTIYTAPVQGSGSSQKMMVLYFAPGVDPPTATTAKYVEFSYNNGTLSNPQAQRDITLTPQGEGSSTETSCSVSGIGWVICPVSIFLAESVDWLFGILADNFIAVQPAVLGDENNSMYVAWNVMRSIANIAFAIVFLIIIYSQLTNFGVSNYGIKKLTPRLIVAAILVNVSFYVAAFAIDLSNIAGYSVQQIFNGIREGLFTVTNDNLSGANTSYGWAAVATVILAGGGVVGTMYFAAAGGVYLLVPLLVGLGLTVLFVVLIFAARQAIIIILVIIAPLAFVANLLPNTEKWFEKWKDLFVTMLIFFPAFALVFGGSQLAGQIIIQNAGDNIISLLFGMAVQIAPLVITPLILKLSGGLLGRIAQIANNPRRGALDRSRNWAERRAEHAKQQSIAQGPRWRNLGGGGLVRSMDFRKRRLQDSTDAWKQEATNEYEKTSKYGDINERQNAANFKKDAIHSGHSAHIEKLKTGQGTDRHNIRGTALDAEAAKERSETAQNETSVYYNDVRTRGSHALRATSYNLEASKLSSKGSDALKSAYYDNQKATAGTVLSRAAVGAESASEDQQAAQKSYEGFLDVQRRTTATPLNVSTLKLDSSRATAERSKSLTSTYLEAEKAAIGSDLHVAHIRAEEAKFSNEAAQAATSRLVREYKSGQIVNEAMTPELVKVMQNMNGTAAEVSAQNQGGEAAQYEISRSIAESMSGSSPRSEALLDIAQGVGGEAARVRARAQAVSTQRRLDQDALTSGVELLKNEALAAQSTIKRYSAGLIQAMEHGDAQYGGQEITSERLKAALQAQAEEKNMSLFERIKGNRNFDQSLINQVISNNIATFKGAGGFHMQEDPSLNIENFANQEEFNSAMRYARVQSLANASASGLSGVKFGWLNEFSKPGELQQNISAAIAQPDGEKYLRMAYTNVREALTNGDIRANIGDREDEVRTIEAQLAKVFGQTPTPDDRPSIDHTIKPE